MEGAKDYDSISGVCGHHGRLQRIDGAGMLATGHLPPSTRHHLQCSPLLLQTCGRFSPRRGQVRKVPAVYQRTNFGQHMRQVLVGHSPEHRMGDREIPHRIQIGRERCHRMRVVGHIQHQGRLARNDLKPPRQFHQ